MYLCWIELGVFSFTGVPVAELACEDITGEVKEAAGQEVVAAVVGGVGAAEEAASEGDKESRFGVFFTGKSFPVKGSLTTVASCLVASAALDCC